MSKIFFKFANKLLGDVKNLEKMSKKTIDLNYVVFAIDQNIGYRTMASKGDCEGTSQSYQSIKLQTIPIVRQPRIINNITVCPTLSLFASTCCMSDHR